MKIRNLAVGSILFGLFFVATATIGAPKAYAGVYADFVSMPSSLPDDRGLYPGSTGLSAAYHHQYMTVSTRTLDDPTIGAVCDDLDDQCASTAEIVVYTYKATTASVNISPTARALNDDCSGGLNFRVMKNGVPEFRANKGFAKSDCAQTIKGSDIGFTLGPGDFVSIPSRPDMRKAVISIRYASGPYEQYSFRISGGESSTKLGFSADSYSNFYPTREAEHNHQMQFRWRPACDVDAGVSPGVGSANYDDGDEGNTVQSTTQGANIRGTLNNVADSDFDVENVVSGPLPNKRIKVGNTYKRTEVTFNNIEGGNGIGFKHPEDSGNYYFKNCGGGTTTPNPKVYFSCDYGGVVAGVGVGSSAASSPQPTRYKVFATITYEDRTTRTEASGGTTTDPNNMLGLESNGNGVAWSLPQNVKDALNGRNTVVFKWDSYYKNSDTLATFRSTSGDLERSDDCLPSAPSMTVTANCNTIVVSGFYEDDAGTKASRITAVVNKRAANGTDTGEKLGEVDLNAGVSTDGDGNVTFNYSAAPGNVNNGYYIHIWGDDYPQGGGGEPTRVDVTQVTSGLQPAKCYTATCSVSLGALNRLDTPTPGVYAVKAGQPFTLVYNITNTGEKSLPSTISNGGANYNLASHSVSSIYAPAAGNIRIDNIGQDIPSSGTLAERTKTINIGLTAPTNVDTLSISSKPDYWGLFELAPIGTCGTTANMGGDVPIYKYFENQAIIGHTQDNIENPERIAGEATISRAAAGTVNVPTSGTIEIKRVRGGNTTLASQTFSGTIDPAQTVSTSWTDGTAFLGSRATSAPGGDWINGEDQCIVLSYNYQRGWYYTPTGDFRETVAGDQNSCHKVTNRPFVRFYGGDVLAGGNFGSPGGTGGEIKTYINKPTNISQGVEYGAGSGAEFGALALGAVSDFTTASLRSTSPNAPKGLTFASGASVFGGNVASTREAPDYFSVTKQIETNRVDSVNLVDLSQVSIVDGKQTYVAPSTGNKVRLTGGNPYSKHHSVFVEGDVFISDNIIYNSSGNWATLDAIPSFELMVRGNIYIASNVTQLDGLFVAQPRINPPAGADTGGKIYTCAQPQTSPTPGALYPKDQVYAGCINKLRVNGTFVAQETRFLRTYSTLSEVPIASQPVTGAPATGGHDIKWTYGEGTDGSDETEATAKTKTGKSRCTRLVEPVEPATTYWKDNWVCFNDDLQIRWWHGGPSGSPTDVAPMNTWDCATFVGVDNAHTWSDNYLCAPKSKNVGLEAIRATDTIPKDSTGKNKICIDMIEPSDTSWTLGKNRLCFNDTSFGGTPDTPLKYKKEVFGTDANATSWDHAAESFRLGPEIYLAKPVQQPASGGRSNGKYDQILTLPPIL